MEKAQTNVDKFLDLRYGKNPNRHKEWTHENYEMVINFLLIEFNTLKKMYESKTVEDGKSN